MEGLASTFRTFTTEPKTRRHARKLAISIARCQEFMEHLWELGLKDCSYETLEFEFIRFFGTNEPRTVKRYLGNPEQVIHYAGASKVIRMNRMSGKVAQFEYLNEKRIPPKRGLLEILGYITRYKKGNETRFRINHETMPYYTTQTTLENEPQETAKIQPEVEENSEASKEEMCVCSYSLIDRSLNHAGLEEEVSIGETSVSSCTERLAEKTNIEATEKEEESYRVHTHKSILYLRNQNYMPQRIQSMLEKPSPKWLIEAEQLLEKSKTLHLTQTSNQKGEKANEQF